MRLLLLIVSLAVVAALVAAPTSTQSADDSGPPRPLSLAEGWEYQPDPKDEGLRRNWKTGNYPRQWTPVAVPHVFDATPAERAFSGTVGWYRLQFTGPATPADFSWVLRFEAARREARVWLNGKEIGSTKDGYTPFTAPATTLRPGATNTLVVRVSNKKGPEIREGWWNWGGLVRGVSLRPRGPVSADSLALIPSVSCTGARCTRAKVTVDTWLVNYTEQPQQPVVAITLTAPSGKQFQVSQPGPLVQPGVRKRTRIAFDVPQPELWSPVDPKLYTARTSVTIGDGRVAVLDDRRFGLRQVTVEDGRLLVNGQVVTMRGAAIQEDLPGRGPALRDEDIEQTVKDLQAVNATVTRAHYLLNPRLLDALDEAGILVWSQAPNYHNDVDLQTRKGRVRALDTVRRTVLNARNHPSILTHSVANELAPEVDKTPGTREFMRQAAKLVRDLDPSVPPSIDILSYPNIPRQKAYDAYPLLGINSYYGWYEGKPGKRSTARLADLEPYLRTMRANYPRNAMAITEFGAEATFSGSRRVKETYEFQADYVAKTLDIADEFPWLAGAIYWTVREFYVKPDWDGGANRKGVARDALHNKGLLHYDGRAKEAFATARARFRSVPVFDK